MTKIKNIKLHLQTKARTLTRQKTHRNSAWVGWVIDCTHKSLRLIRLTVQNICTICTVITRIKAIEHKLTTKVSEKVHDFNKIRIISH